MYHKNMNITGTVVSNHVYQLRFASSGKLVKVNCEIGQRVAKGQLLAQLDPTQLQTYLDRALKVYEQTRADFEKKQSLNLDQYEKTKLQSELDIAVKSVEIAKQNLEETNLYAPTDGLITQADPAIPGINITPAGHTLCLLADNTYYFQGQITPDELTQIDINKVLNINIANKTTTGKIILIGPVADKTGKLPVHISLDDQTGLYLGLPGTAVA